MLMFHLGRVVLDAHVRQRNLSVYHRESVAVGDLLALVFGLCFGRKRG